MDLGSTCLCKGCVAGAAFLVCNSLLGVHAARVSQALQGQHCSQFLQ
jgi:hypothetical protein